LLAGVCSLEEEEEDHDDDNDEEEGEEEEEWKRELIRAYFKDAW
jgi:hypothetical protein